MAAPIVKVYSTTAEKINSLPVEDGNLIFVSDVKMLYLDLDGQRMSYNLILSLETEYDRIHLPTPLNGYYFVESTGIMWRYRDKWIQITDGCAPYYIYKDSIEEFPENGNERQMYAENGAIYRWNAKKKQYECLSNRTSWERIGG